MAELARPSVPVALAGRSGVRGKRAWRQHAFGRKGRGAYALLFNGDAPKVTFISSSEGASDELVRRLPYLGEDVVVIESEVEPIVAQESANEGALSRRARRS